MKTRKPYLNPNYAKKKKKKKKNPSWKTYVSKPSGSIHKHVAAKSLPLALTFLLDLHR